MNRTGIAATTIALLLVPAFAGAALPLPPIGDYIPDRPTGPWVEVKILTPITHAEVGGQLLIEGTAKPAKGYQVGHVNVYIDNVYMGRAQGSENWSFALDTRTLVDGPHNFRIYAYAAPKASLVPLYFMSYTLNATFHTLNHQLGVVLYERTFNVTGAMADNGIIPVNEDYTGLMITFEGANKGSLLSAKPRGEVLFTYKQTSDGDQIPTRTWVASYGTLGAGVFISKPPHGVLKAPGVIDVASAFAGQGQVTVKVVAVPAASLT